MPRALVVDGNAEDAAAMAATLGSRGFVVEVVHDRDAALGALERARPDVVLLDVAGPARGMEILDQIRAKPALASMPVVIVTAEAGDDEVLKGYKFGADYYLTKPVTPRRLLRGIGLVLGREFPE